MSKDTELLLVSDGADWALDQVANELISLMGGDSTTIWRSAFSKAERPRVFLSPDIFLASQRLGVINPGAARGFVNFFHGLPQDGSRFAFRLAMLKKFAHNIRGIRTTTEVIADQLREHSITDNIVSIPLGVDVSRFAIQDKVSREIFRHKLGIQQDAIVIGSFQKDGMGWGLGEQPKLEKGPDVLVNTLVWLLKNGVPVHALLTGPSRGYVTQKLATEDVPFTYLGNVPQSELSKVFGMTDSYLVTSRFEGGPRSILESLASGRPVVSTDVGQASSVLRDHSDSRVVGTWNPQELGSAVLEVLRKWDEVRSPAKARMHALKFSIENFQGDWSEFLSKNT